MTRVRRPYGERSDRPARRDLHTFLREERRSGYPPEYLLSRLRGRSSKLITNWRSVLLEASPADHLASAKYQGFVRERTLDGMWRSLLVEHGWVYGQMDETLRRDFAPYFLYVELRTLFMCLRYLEGERPQQVGEVLEPSLLSREVTSLLRTDDAASALRGLEDLLNSLSPRFAGLAERYAQDGLRAVERSVTDVYLGHVLTLPLRPVIHAFFVRLVDARNILALFKAHRLGARDPSVFLAGGTIPPERLTNLMDRGDPYAVLPLVRQTTGISLADPETSRLETALYRGITKFLKKEARDPLGAGIVLEYLWRCSLEITNLSLLFAGKDLEREELAAELVY
jgi:hypothetical protein